MTKRCACTGCYLCTDDAERVRQDVARLRRERDALLEAARALLLLDTATSPITAIGTAYEALMAAVAACEAP